MSDSLPDWLESKLVDAVDGGDPHGAVDALARAHADHAAAIERWARTAWQSGTEHQSDDGHPARIGPYEIRGVLGAGGMGTVYRAYDARLQREVAVKSIRRELLDSAEARSRFEREARAASRLEHPNICTVHEVGESDGRPFMVMPLIRGRSLAELLRSESLGTMRVAELMEKIARALHCAHGAGLIHRDVKPGNVFVNEDGEPVVLDFGLARDLEADDAELSRTAQPLGTPRYMAPEQVRGDRGAVGPRTDVYGLGALLFESTVGRPPFEAKDIPSLYDAILNEPTPRLRRLDKSKPRDLEIIVERALEKSPSDRYASAEALADDLRRLQEHRPIEARPAGRWVRAVRWTQRNTAAAIALGILTIGLTAATILAFQLANARDAAQVARQNESEAKDSERLEARDSALRGGRLARILGQWDTALTELDDALSKDDGSRRFEIQLERSLVFESLSRSREAADVLNGIDPATAGAQEAAVRLRQGELLLGLEDDLTGIETALEVHRSGSSTLTPADAVYARALLSDDLAQIESLLAEARTLDPFHRRSAYTRGFSLLALGRTADALQLAREVQSTFPLDYEPHLLESLSLALLGELDAARSALELSRSKIPGEVTHDDLFAVVTFCIDLLEKLAHEMHLLAEWHSGNMFGFITKGPNRFAQMVRLMPLITRIGGLLPAFERAATNPGRAGSLRVPISLRKTLEPLIPEVPSLLRTANLAQMGKAFVGLTEELNEPAAHWVRARNLMIRESPNRDEAFWKEGAAASRKAWTSRGFTGQLPEFRRAYAALHIGLVGQILLGQGNEPERELIDEMYAVIDEVTQLPGLTETEYHAYTVRASNLIVRLDEYDLVDRVLERWRRAYPNSIRQMNVRAETRLNTWPAAVRDLSKRALVVQPNDARAKAHLEQVEKHVAEQEKGK